MAIEVEIKTQVSDRNALEDAIHKRGGQFITSDRQLNHYYTFDQDATHVLHEIRKALAIDRTDFEKLIRNGKKFSVRTRCEYEQLPRTGKTTLYIKYSIDDTTSENGIRRQEFAWRYDGSIEELDDLITRAGMRVQAKWSRTRRTWKLNSITIVVDFNAGYGWLAEFEKEVGDEKKAIAAEKELREVVDSFGLKPIDQEKLARMFAYYNKHWEEYYLTEKTFTVE
jgi:adenylate cyclase class IV